MLLAGFGSGPSCCSSSLVFSVKHTSQWGIPALNGQHFVTIFHLTTGVSSGFLVLSSQNLVERVVPGWSGWLKSNLCLPNPYPK